MEVRGGERMSSNEDLLEFETSTGEIVKFSDFEIMEMIGEGSFGRVFKV